MDPVEDGPVVLTVWCRCRGRSDPYEIAEVRLRPGDGHRVLHAKPYRGAKAAEVLEGLPPIDLDDEERRRHREEARGKGGSLATPEGRAALRGLAARMMEKPWLFCRCGQVHVQADWLRRKAPTEPSHPPRRAWVR